MSLLDRALAAMIAGQPHATCCYEPDRDSAGMAATPEGRALADLVEAAVADDGHTGTYVDSTGGIHACCWACEGTGRPHHRKGCPVDAFREAVER